MEPLNNGWTSTRSRVYGRMYALTPYSEAWRSVYNHLWDRFDLPFIDKDE